MQPIHEVVELQPPLGGLFRGLGHAQKPPGYSEDMLNVRAFDALEGRGRIGSRPGLVKAFQTQLGSGNPIRLASVIRTFNSTGTTLFVDEFVSPSNRMNFSNWTGGKSLTTGTTGFTNASPGLTFDDNDGTHNDWTSFGIAAGDVLEILSGTGVTVESYRISAVAVGTLTLAVTPGFSGTGITYRVVHPWIVNTQAAAEAVQPLASIGLPYVANGLAQTQTGANARSAMLIGVTDISTTGYRELALLNPSFAASSNIVTLHLDLAAANPSESLGIALLCSYARMELLVDGVIKASFGWTPTGTESNVVRLTIDGAKVIRGYRRSLTVPDLAYDASTIYTPTASPRAGFSLRTDSPNFQQTTDAFSVLYESTSAGTPPEAAMMSSNHILYRESLDGALAAVSGSPSNVNLASDRKLHATARLQNLYIADYEIRRKGTGTVIQDSGNRLDDSAVTSWNALGIDIDGDVLEILDVTGTVLPGVYAIASIHDTEGVRYQAGGSFTAGAATYRILRYPKIFDASTNLLTRFGTGTFGTSQAPAGCRSVVLWGDRLVWCNNAEAPHGWWMSAAGYPLNYDYGDLGIITPPGTALGVAAAVSGTQAEFAGLIGEPLVTTIPVNDDLLILACKTSFYYLNGNPRLNGSILNISREIGIVDIGAWCRTADGRLIVLTPDGLYELTTQQAKSLSRELLPKELIDLKDDKYDISLAYDVARRGLVIAASSKDVGGVVAAGVAIPSIHYFYDLRTGAFLPESHAVAVDPTAAVSYQAGGIGMPTVLWGCRDGYVRRFEEAAQADDGTTFNSYVLYGPVRLGGSDYGDGILHELVCVLDVASGSVTLSVHVGYNAQAAKSATARYSTTMTAGRNRNRYPRLRGCVAYVKITGTPGSSWAIESLTVTREKIGRLAVV